MLYVHAVCTSQQDSISSTACKPLEPGDGEQCFPGTFCIGLVRQLPVELVSATSGRS